MICAPALGFVGAAAPVYADEAGALRAALSASAAGDWQGALLSAQGAGAVGGDIILWHWLRAGEGKLGDYEAFLARRPDWPGLPLLKEKGEIAAARSDDANRVLAYFGADKPRSGIGSVALARALAALGRQDEARAEAMRGWRDLKFDAEGEAAMIAFAGAVVDPENPARMDGILWDGARAGELQRLISRLPADYAALARARAALQADSPDAPALVEAVPASLAQDAGLAFDRYDFRMRAGRYDDAADMILARSASAAGLGDAQKWGKRRADLARILMRQGQAALAYRVAASHHLTSGDEFVDLSFLAGFIALRKLNDPASALPHFAAMEGAVVTPISQARAQYWMARAYEAEGDGANARARYERAAKHQTAFYGLLAAERLGLTLDPALVNVGQAQPTWKTAAFANSSVLAAARLLLDAGDLTLSKRFLVHLSEGMDAASLAALADLALRLEQPHLALIIAKQAAERGVILPRAYYPLPDFVPDNLPVSRALALAITRRESEFDPSAQSSVGARGLMQVMPETAAEVARSIGETSSENRLIADPAFNVRMGSAYLADLVAKFGPAIALVASGYNAGPSRPARWIKDYGDPRGAVDVIDWIETIPFTETRTYVMRVAESTLIYRARLKGQAGPVDITAELTGQ